MRPCPPSKRVALRQLTHQAPSPRAQPGRLLTVEEVADQLRVSKTTVYRLVERRLLPFYRLPGSLRFAEADVLAFLHTKRVEPPEPITKTHL